MRRVLGAMVILLLVSGTVYKLIFLKAAREGWPVASQIERFAAERDEFEPRDGFHASEPRRHGAETR